ncbi:MAG: hypothetical protein AAF202_05110, partial [Pseudomonadota bacterium]
ANGNSSTSVIYLSPGHSINLNFSARTELHPEFNTTWRLPSGTNFLWQKKLSDGRWVDAGTNKTAALRTINMQANSPGTQHYRLRVRVPNGSFEQITLWHNFIVKKQ